VGEDVRHRPEPTQPGLNETVTIRSADGGDLARLSRCPTT
jgi:hypothetical protein